MSLSYSVLTALFSQCAASVAPDTLHSIVQVESAGNPFAVAIVQSPNDKNFIKYKNSHSLEEAKALVKLAKDNNKRYSVGLMQVNSINFLDYSVNETNMFDACSNIKVGSNILKKYYLIAKKNNPNKNEQELLRIATSYYYSGNKTRGFKKEATDNKSYVDRINSTVDKKYIVPAIKSYQEQASVPMPVTEINQVVKKPNEWDVFNDFK